MGARARLPEMLASMSRSELENVIYESALHHDDDLIARRYIVDKWAQADIAAELGWTRSTVGNHVIMILQRASDVAKRININHT